MKRSNLWVPLSVNFIWDPQVMACSTDAQLLFVRGLCLAKQVDSGGALTPKQVASVCFDLPEHGASACQDLLRHDLWFASGDDYRIRGWAKWNRSPDEARKLSAKRADAGRKGGYAKAQQSASGLVGKLPVRRVEESREEFATESKLPVGAVNGARRGSRIPDPFEVSDELADWAGRNLPGFDWRTETPVFLDYWRGRSGKDGVKQDWPATWRNWMRKASVGR